MVKNVSYFPNFWPFYSLGLRKKICNIKCFAVPRYRIDISLSYCKYIPGWDDVNHEEFVQNVHRTKQQAVRSEQTRANIGSNMGVGRVISREIMKDSSCPPPGPPLPRTLAHTIVIYGDFLCSGESNIFGHKNLEFIIVVRVKNVSTVRKIWQCQTRKVVLYVKHIENIQTNILRTERFTYSRKAVIVVLPPQFH